MRSTSFGADRRTSEASAAQSLGSVLKFTALYGLVALALLAGQSSLRPDLKADLADASGDLRAPAMEIAGFKIRLASAE